MSARPSLPDVTLWSMGTCARCDRAKELLSSVGCKVEVRDLGTSPPTADELRALAGWLAHAGERRAGSPAAPREFVRTTGAGRALLRSKQDDQTPLAEPAAHPALL